MAPIKEIARSLTLGAGLLVTGVIMGGMLTLASLLITQSVTSSDACGAAVCHNGVSTVAEWHGFPFGITERPVEPFQDCDVIDCYPLGVHKDSVIADVCVWSFVSFGVIGFVVIGIKKGESIESYH